LEWTTDADATSGKRQYQPTTMATVPARKQVAEFYQFVEFVH
jgi:hypothetical protein